MPTYEYRCDACHHQFDLFQSIKDSPKRKCPKCGKNTLQRLIGTGAAVLFKGSGFYQTDYRSDSYKKAAESEKPKSDAPGKKDSPAANGAKTPAQGKPAKADKAAKDT
jgi:putative FmdB family regulatory protein